MRLSYWESSIIVVVKFYAKSSMKIQKLIENLIIENFQKSVFFLFESADSVLPISASSQGRRILAPSRPRGSAGGSLL